MSNVKDTGLIQQANFGGDTSISGPVKQADVEFAGISVKNQAFSEWSAL
jgi:hypothetical protein